ncbi:WD and tetratricopeptide repeats protein 1 isoform X1 [Zerene cesonia]|uniref:WD and tetratricopeptide repeats protein 1 isoform X1 n=1 Tax=Zerene cesonia TaxID=33412 RepID=UPI0018E550C9|nr:WD and tetratricopeptide repeats protein 1 isoform X1 [Zerene cesonia]
MGRREEPAWMQGTVGLTVARERGDIGRKFQNRLLVTRSMIDRLGLESELHGHMGCVNCLEWSKDGSVLASASDDLHVILWDPFRYKQLHNITTGHTGNIFSVKFLSSDIVATCAADGSVRARNVCGGTSLLECACHSGRVKRLAVAPDKPHLLWSAGEDGLVLQHDLRMPHRCNSDCANVLVNLLNHMGRYAEAKCVAVNPRRPYQLAVGANDFYVRLYDTRMIKLGRLQVGDADFQMNAPMSRLMWERQNVRCSRAGHGDPDNNIPRAAVQYFAPGHLSMEPNDHTYPKKAVTYIAFSHDGNELLVNLGSEQVYLYDINSARRPVFVESFIIQHNHGYREGEAKNGTKTDTKNGTSDTKNGTNNGTVIEGSNGTVDQQLPEKVQQMKEMANELVNRSNYSAAVELYNVAISECPNCAILYSNRAAALMRRGWSGDTYAAIRDCYKAIKLDANHVKSHFRLAKGLMDLKRAREAHECLLYFKDRFPKHATSHAVFLLQKDINVALESMETQPDEASEEEGQNGSALERQLRSSALDYSHRFLGHCNTTTDIKEANFLGPDANFLAAGSDDGSMFVWSRRSGNIVRCLRADESILNCVQLHPSMFLLATSGIEAVVRLWSPKSEDGSAEGRLVDGVAAAAANQQRMRSDPFEAMLLNISFAGGPERDLQSPVCRAT